MSLRRTSAKLRASVASCGGYSFTQRKSVTVNLAV